MTGDREPLSRSLKPVTGAGTALFLSAMAGPRTGPAMRGYGPSRSLAFLRQGSSPTWRKPERVPEATRSGASRARPKATPGFQCFGYALKVRFDGGGVVQLLVLGLLAMPERRRLPALHRGEGYRPRSFLSWPATGKPRSYAAFSSAMRRCFASSSRCDAPPGELLLPWRMQASVLFGSETQTQ
jgi:hypothetical protein